MPTCITFECTVVAILIEVSGINIFCWGGGAKSYIERQSTCARGSKLVIHMLDGWTGVLMYLDDCNLMK